ncbi:protein of unknown function [Maridesulfovibrio hydrothermalis AM13 = DSM 14728]|uniref:Uncharacterized protein n=1 Tax=Maridesulfovibrio hydrothermalis AM13 = DSM 14728 TaxID=1121451 RepID=L0RCB8_9BACT|nr:protein of unknown function [Maridesulfovibrio hydrothermalis AM13 = DSM 14728]
MRYGMAAGGRESLRTPFYGESSYQQAAIFSKFTSTFESYEFEGVLLCPVYM